MNKDGGERGQKPGVGTEEKFRKIDIEMRGEKRTTDLTDR